MNKETIKLLVRQAKTYIMMSKCLKNESSKKMYLQNSKKCIKLALEIQRQLDLNKTITMEYKLTA